MADDFTRHLFAWLDRVAADRDVSPLGFKLAYVIGGFISRKTGDAWPSQETIASRLGVTVRAVRNLVDQLAGAGHLEDCRCARSRQDDPLSNGREKPERWFPFSSVTKGERRFRFYGMRAGT